MIVEHPTIVWARYLLRFLIFRQAFSAKPHIRDHRYCSAYAPAGGSLVVIRVNASMVGETGLEPVRPHGQRILSPLRLPIPPLPERVIFFNLI